jgi:hypothetical protein
MNLKPGITIKDIIEFDNLDLSIIIITKHSDLVELKSFVPIKPTIPAYAYM